MVSVDDLTISAVYFMLWYIDSDLRIPEINTMVYIGKDLENELFSDKLNKFYFQDARSYFEYGNGINIPDLEGEILVFDEDNFGSIHNLSSLIQELTEID